MAVIKRKSAFLGPTCYPISPRSLSSDSQNYSPIDFPTAESSDFSSDTDFSHFLGSFKLQEGFYRAFSNVSRSFEDLTASDSSTDSFPVGGVSLNLDGPTESLTSPRNHLRAADRFVPTRHLNTAVADVWKTNKDSAKLTPYEKLLRHHSASPDIFASPIRTHHSSPLTYHYNPTAIPTSPRGATSIPVNGAASANGTERQVSVGNIWAVGGVAPSITGISDGRGRLISSGSNAPLYTTAFSHLQPTADEEREVLECRLAKALDLDRAQRIYDYQEYRDPLQLSSPRLIKKSNSKSNSQTLWNGTQWVNEGSPQILDAPNLRDDFYCSVLAYSPTAHLLAVGLGPMLYAWSEAQGVRLLSAGTANGPWITSVAFSSAQGCKAIAAFGKSDGTLTLMSIYDRRSPRFEAKHPCPIACVSWRPSVNLQPSRNPASPGLLTSLEELLVGDESGHVYYYSVEWPTSWEAEQHGWTGAMTLIARISIHTQQICGLAWSLDGSVFATGGNDNICCLFESAPMLAQSNGMVGAGEETVYEADGGRRTHVVPGYGRAKVVVSGAEKHRWIHGAAVKAIAFCPWRDGLVATGGGSNDRCIHFYHTHSGACLATISVSAQVTSLIWSTTRREIAATFGYAQPEHPYRVAVFSWPECRQVAAIPWEGEHRALYAISYPGHFDPSSQGEAERNQEGCIVVAASDESVKFHEVWAAGNKTTVGGEGLLGGSDILEGLEGIDKEGEVIR